MGVCTTQVEENRHDAVTDCVTNSVTDTMVKIAIEEFNQQFKNTAYPKDSKMYFAIAPGPYVLTSVATCGKTLCYPIDE